MTFLYQFHPAGQSVSLGGENELSIGLASALSIEAAAFSTLTEAVLQSESVLDAVLPQDGQVLIHLPETLSLDECTAAYLAKQYLENGRIPKSAAKLAFYVQSSGDRTVRADANADTLYTLGFILLLLQEYYASYTLNERNLLLLEKSEILFKRASINLLLDPYYDLASAPIAKDEPQFVMEINSAADDFNRYISDKSDPDCCCVLHTPRHAVRRCVSDPVLEANAVVRAPALLGAAGWISAVPALRKKRRGRRLGSSCGVRAGRRTGAGAGLSLADVRIPRAS